MASLVYYWFFFARAYGEIELAVEQPSWFKIYWAEENQPFSEKRAAKVRVKPDRKSYGFYLTDLHNVDRLRIDTHQYEGKARLSRLQLHQKSLASVELVSAGDFAQLSTLAQVEQVTVDDDGLTVASSGIDPNFLLALDLGSQPVNWAEEGVRILALGLLVFLIYGGAARLSVNYRYVPICFGIVLALAVTMAFSTEDNVHPDEFVHMPAANYYTDNWLPPVIDSEEIRHTYSPYGASRLNTNEVYYLLAGKFTRLVEPFNLGDYISFRVFNLFLLSLIFLYVVRVPDSRIMALPLLITPQVWYLFSYCNSDAFAITAMFFAACQVCVPESTLHRYLKSSSMLKLIYWLLVLGVLFGSILLLKKNYYVFVGFLGLAVIVQQLKDCDRTSWGKIAFRLGIVGVIGAAIYGSKLYSDHLVNGPDRSAKITEIRKELAIPIYNPDTPLEEKHVFLHLRERGIPLEKLIVVDRWFEKTFRSAVGVYGYFTVSATETYYNLVRWSAVILLTFVAGSILFRGGVLNSLSLAAALGLSGALIGASLYHSWTMDFQTQGRYLFPVLGMLSIIYGQNREMLNSRWLSLFTMVLFCLSFYSFSLVGLYQLPRLVLP